MQKILCVNCSDSVDGISGTVQGAPLDAKNLQAIRAAEKAIRKDAETTRCEQIVNSNECQSLYAQINKNGDQADRYKRNCAQEAKNDGTDQSLQLIETVFFGTENAERKKLRRDERGFLVGVGKSLVSLPESLYKDYRNAQECDHNLNEKKQFFNAYNSNRPKDLQVKMPSLEWFNTESCAAVQDYIKMTGTRLYVNKLYNAGVKFKSVGDEIPDDVATISRGLYQLAKQKLKNLGVKYECYNSKKRAELIGEVSGAIAMTAMPPGVSIKILRVAGLTSFADTADIAFAADATVATVSPEALKSADATARIEEAEKLLGRQLTEKQKAALVEAHNYGQPKMVDGELRYSPKDVRAKAKILAKAGFKVAKINGGKDEIRTLMESRIVGKFNIDSYLNSGPRTPGTKVWVIDQKTGKLVDASIVEQKASAPYQGMYEVKIGEIRGLFNTTNVTEHYPPESIFTPVEPGDQVGVVKTSGYVANGRVMSVDRDRNLAKVVLPSDTPGINEYRTVSLDQLQKPLLRDEHIWFKSKDGSYQHGAIAHLQSDGTSATIVYKRGHYMVHENIPFRDISRHPPTDDEIAAQLRAQNEKIRASHEPEPREYTPSDFQRDRRKYSSEYHQAWKSSPVFLRFNEKFDEQQPNIRRLYEINEYVRTHGPNPAMEQEAKQIYRRLRSDLHPDKYSGVPPDAENYITSRFKEVKEQYEQIEKTR